MWPKSYKNYPSDQPLKKNEVEAGKGIIGCEMHELNGWGTELHIPKKRRKGIVTKFLAYLFGSEKETLGDS